MIDLPEPPWGVAATPGAVWATGGEPGAIQRLDVATGVLEAVARAERPFLLTPGSDHLWVSDNAAGTLLRIGLGDRSVLATSQVGEGPWGIAADLDLVWFSDHPGDRIGRVDPVSGFLVDDVPTDGWPSTMLLAFGRLWVACWRDGTVCAHDPTSGALLTRICVSEGPGVHGLAATADRLWVTQVEEGAVYPVDPAGGSVGALVPVGASPWCVVAHAEQVWVSCTDDASLWVIDAVTGTATSSFATPTAPYGIAADARGLWVGVRRPPGLVRFPWS